MAPSSRPGVIKKLVLEINTWDKLEAESKTKKRTKTKKKKK